MAFFQDLGKKISTAASDASKKTSEMIEISKLNSSINAEKSSITEVQKKIGGLVYELFISGEQLSEVLVADLQIIAEKNQNIAGFENKIAEIKAEAERHKEEAALVAAAAQEQRQQQQAEAASQPPVQQAEAASQPPEQQAPPAAGTKFCVGCGAPLESGMIFCGTCGTKND